MPKIEKPLNTKDGYAFAAMVSSHGALSARARIRNKVQALQ